MAHTASNVNNSREDKTKLIHDTVHGGIEIGGFILELMSTPELMRLANIKQLGTTYLVFPGAHHSRLEHSLGAYYLANKLAKKLGLDEHENALVSSAALLHDVGHGPFSHVLETTINEKTGMDHMDLTKEIISGSVDMGYYGKGKNVVEWGKIPGILERAGLDPKEVADLVKEHSSPETSLHEWLFGPVGPPKEGAKRYLYQMINGVVDVDQLDYLVRDAHYTGVAHGIIDLERILHTLEIFNGELVVHRKGITAVEGMLVARSLMYTTVYFHKTSRISQQMLGRAFERVPAGADGVDLVPFMIDGEFLEWLAKQGDFQREIVERIKYRSLYKSAYARNPGEMTETEKEFFSTATTPSKRRILEAEIAEMAGVREDSIIVDVPLPELLFSEPRIAKTDVKVTDGRGLHALSEYSTISDAIQKRTVPMWGAVVATRPEDREKVRNALMRYFNP